MKYEMMMNESKVFHMLDTLQIFLLIGTRSLKYQEMMPDVRGQ